MCLGVGHARSFRPHMLTLCLVLSDPIATRQPAHPLGRGTGGLEGGESGQKMPCQPCRVTHQRRSRCLPHDGEPRSGRYRRCHQQQHPQRTRGWSSCCCLTHGPCLRTLGVGLGWVGCLRSGKKDEVLCPWYVRRYTIPRNLSSANTLPPQHSRPAHLALAMCYCAAGC